MIRLAAPDVIKHLDSMVARVGDDEPATFPVKVDRMWRRKLPVAGAAGSKLEYWRAVGLQDLHAIVARVGNGEQAIACDRHALRPRELAGARALRPGHEGRHAVDVVNVDAMVARVGNGDQVSLRRERDGCGASELPDGAALRPKGAGKRAVRIEYLDAMVARVGDGDQAVGAYRGALGRRELPVAGAARANVKGMGAVGVEHLDAIAGNVGNDDRAGPQAVRRIAASVGMRLRVICNKRGGKQRRHGNSEQRREGPRR